jgi:putative peptide zinc metalloprotease protein
LQGNIFSDSWYKVANLRVSLNNSNYIKKQYFRGQKWYVIEDSFNNQFYRFSPEAYKFIIKLDHSKTVEELWEKSLNSDSLNTPTQDEVISLLTSLHHKNLLYFKNRADNEQLFIRANEKQKQKMKSKVFSFLYFKIPLLDPNNWLNSIQPIISTVISKKFLFLWIAVIALGLKHIIENFSMLYDQTQGMLAPDKLFLLYISIILLKTLHELGHAMMVKKFGGKVNEMGVMILIFTPIPYMDATQSWLFRSKIQRALVGAAGMIIELFIASIAAIIWANTGDGLVNSISFNIMIIGSVSSIFFNGNPLLRFDSYFILSDLLEIPNLYETSKKQWFYLIEKYIFNSENTISPSKTKVEAFWMYSYGFGSFFYRLLVAYIIAIFVADQWFLLGVIVVLLSLYMWIIKPFFTFLKYIFTNQNLLKNRLKVLGISFSFFIFLYILLFVIPYPFSLKANGIIMSDSYENIYTNSDGYLVKTLVEDGAYVHKGQTLLEFKNEELDYEIKNIKASINEAKAYLIKARSNAKADMYSIRKHLYLLNDKLNYLNDKKSKLVIKANASGYFIYQNIQNRVGTWFELGQKIGMLIPNNLFYIQAVVPQEESFNMFFNERYEGSLKLYGLNEKTFSISNIKIIPYQKEELPSAALGWLGGGEIAVSQKDDSGIKTRESFFEVRGNLKDIKDLDLQHGRSGVLKIRLDSKTLVERIVISVKQLLQKHYKI